MRLLLIFFCCVKWPFVHFNMWFHVFWKIQVLDVLSVLTTRAPGSRAFSLQRKPVWCRQIMEVIKTTRTSRPGTESSTMAIGAAHKHTQIITQVNTHTYTQTLTHISDMWWIPTSARLLYTAELADPVGGPGVAIDPDWSVDLHTIFSATLQVKEGEVPPLWRVGGHLRADNIEAVVVATLAPSRPKIITTNNVFLKQI